MLAGVIQGGHWFVREMDGMNSQGLFRGGMGVRRKIGREFTRGCRAFYHGSGRRRGSLGLIMISEDERNYEELVNI